MADAAKRAGVKGEYHAKYFEDEPSEFSKMIAELLNGNQQEETAAAPRGWFGIAAMNRQLAERRVIQDVAMLARAGSVQASCLDCRAYRPAAPRNDTAEAKGLFATLALLIR